MPNSHDSILGHDWKSLIWENPMAIEVSRFRRKFFESGRGKAVNSMVMVVAIIAYAALLLVVANFAGDLPPMVLIMVQTGVFALIGPALMFGSIAGERERRSWDLLLAAPITHAQIVMGKFMAGVAALGGVLALFLIPTGYALFTYESLEKGSMPSGLSFILQEVVSVCFGLCVLAVTLFFSARCRRSLMALGITLTTLFISLLALPSLASVLGGGRNGAADLFVLFHPFATIFRLYDYSRDLSGSGTSFSSYDFLSMGWWGAPQALLYLGFTGVFLVWTLKTVNFADGEKKFIPKRPNARS